MKKIIAIICSILLGIGTISVSAESATQIETSETESWEATSQPFTTGEPVTEKPTPQKTLKDLNKVTVDDSNLKKTFYFIGKDITPIVELKDGGKKLEPHQDYKVSYKSNFYPGTATITIEGIGNYTGKIIRNYNIAKMPIGDVTIRTSFDSSKQLVVQVNNGSYAMTKDKDYTYSVNTDAKGNITITFTGLGNNYTGTYVRNIPADENPNKPVAPTVKQTKIKTIKNKKGKKVKLTWKKISNANGYKIRYSTNKNLKKAKTKTVKKNTTKYTIKKLKLKKKYYIQVRAYKIVDGKTYYGKWSKSKKVKIAK